MANPQGSRVNGVMYVSVLIVATLILRLAFLQVIQGEHHAQLAERNLSRFVTIPAPRGLILDRNGEIIVRNEYRYEVGMKISPRSEWEEDFKTLEKFFTRKDINLWRYEDDETFENDKRGIVERKKNQLNTHKRYQDTVILETRLTKEMVFELEEMRWEWPHIDIVERPIRFYEETHIIPHLLQPLKSDGTPREGSIEEAWNDYLMGVNGNEIWAVDVKSVPLGKIDTVTPTPGNNVVLTIDMELQKFVQDTLREGIHEIQQNQLRSRQNPVRHGAAVVVDVRSGDILAIASYPDFDVFDMYNFELFKEVDYQLNQGFRRARTTEHILFYPTRASFGIGSTAKILSSIIAVQEGVITPNQRFNDRGIFYARHDTKNQWPINNFNNRAYGNVNLREAMQVSLNSYFAWMMDNLSSPYSNDRNMARITQYTNAFGLTGETGLTDVIGQRTYNTIGSIFGGQTDASRFPIGSTSVINASPLHMANLVSMVANRGYHYRPRLVREVLDSEGNVVETFEPEIQRIVPKELNPDKPNDIYVSDRTYDIVLDAMKAVTQFSPRTGTSAWAFNGFPLQIAAKTGTADAGTNLESHSWWVGFAPIDEPEIAVVLFTEQSGSTGVNSQMARKIMDQYFGFNVKTNEE